MVIVVPRGKAEGRIQSQIEKSAASAFSLPRRSLFSYVPLRRAAELIGREEEAVREFVYTRTKKLHAIKLFSGNLVFHPDSLRDFLKEVLQTKLLIELGDDHLLKGPGKAG